MLLVASKVWGSAGLLVSIASESDKKILGQASTMLPIDIDSLQKLDKMHGQSMDKISLTQRA